MGCSGAGWAWGGTGGAFRSLTCKLEAGPSAEDGAVRIVGRALVDPGILVPIQVPDDQVAPRQNSPLVRPEIDRRAVQ